MSLALAELPLDTSYLQVSEVDQRPIDQTVLSGIHAGIMRTRQTDHLEYSSGAEGYTDAMLWFDGELEGTFRGHVATWLPRAIGNVLLVPRSQIFATRAELRCGDGAVPFGTEVHPVRALMVALNSMPPREALRYDACVAYEELPDADKLTFVTKDLGDTLSLRIPRQRIGNALR